MSRHGASAARQRPIRPRPQSMSGKTVIQHCLDLTRSAQGGIDIAADGADMFDPAAQILHHEGMATKPHQRRASQSRPWAVTSAGLSIARH